MNPLRSWTDQQRCAFLYRVCADAETSTRRADVFRRLAGEAEARAAIHRAQLTARGLPVPAPYRPDARTRLAARMIATVGVRRSRVLLVAMRLRGAAADAVRDDDAGPAGTTSERSAERTGIDHRRACALGLQHGTIANAALVAGIVAAQAPTPTIMLAGLVAMCAGAASTAVRDFSTARLLRRGDTSAARTSDAPSREPKPQVRELAPVHAAKPATRREAARTTGERSGDPVAPASPPARDSSPATPEPVSPSPWSVAARSFASFAAGASVPVAPYVFLPVAHAHVVALGASGAAVFATAAVVASASGRAPFGGGVRMLALAATVAGVAFGVGRLLGLAPA